MPNPVVVHSDDYACDIGPHVFPTEKYAGVRTRLVSEGWVTEDAILEPPLASREELLAVHTPEFLADLEALRWSPRTMRSELPLTEEIVRAYVRAAGGTLLASRRALDQRAGIHLGGGFHHAYADHAEGFCYLNDLAVAARVLEREGRIRRAAVVDLDVHQGNGTARIFEGDPSVFTLSIHQENNYPVLKERGSLDVGLADRTGDADYLRELERALERALERVWEFAPGLVLYQAGADPYADDVLGGLGLSLDGLQRRDRMVIEGCAARDIPVVVTLGGGYARRVEDTVAIHAATCRIAADVCRAPSAEAPQ